MDGRGLPSRDNGVGVPQLGWSWLFPRSMRGGAKGKGVFPQGRAWAGTVPDCNCKPLCYPHQKMSALDLGIPLLPLLSASPACGLHMYRKLLGSPTGRQASPLCQEDIPAPAPWHCCSWHLEPQAHPWPPWSLQKGIFQTHRSLFHCSLTLHWRPLDNLNKDIF